jgi:hypothetical protein
MTETEALMALRRDFAELVADGMKPDAIHAAFAVIDGLTDRKTVVAG